MSLTVTISRFIGGISYREELASMQPVANYLYELVGKYAFKAGGILDGNTGGIIAGISSNIQYNYEPVEINFTVGNQTQPIDNTSTFQDNRLKGAMFLNHILSDDGVLQLNKNDFTLNSITGVLDISPNKFFDGMGVTMNFFKITNNITGISSPASQYVKQTFNADGYYDVPQGYVLRTAFVLPSMDTFISWGTTLGGSEVYPSTEALSSTGQPFDLNFNCVVVAQRIYITGITSPTEITFKNENFT